MKILLFNYEFPPLGGGAASATGYILKEFSKYEGLSVDLVTSSLGGFRIEHFSDNCIIHFLGISKKGNLHYQTNKELLTYTIKAYGYGWNLIKNKQFNLIHAFFGIPCGWIAMRLGLPYIVSLRGSDVPFFNERFRHLDKFIFKRISKRVWDRSSRTVANSRKLRDLALDSSPHQPIEVIPNGIDTHTFSCKRYEPVDILRIISVGRLIPRKGMIYLIEALRGLSDVSLTIVGEGPLIDELKYKTRGINASFLGYVPRSQMGEVYRSHDLFALPSLNEGMSNTLLEAMASGLPVIVTDTGGTGELLHGNGFVVPFRDSGAIGKSVKQFMEKPELLRKMGQKSREIAESMSWANVAQGYYNLYQECAL